VHAALFALQSPLSKGAILADEVGLGKTIEAGLVIAQRWAESCSQMLVEGWGNQDLNLGPTDYEGGGIPTQPLPSSRYL